MNIKIPLLSILIFAGVFFQAEAAYLKNVPQTRTQPDGTILNCMATGDEYHNWLHDSNNFTIIQDSLTGFYVYAAKPGTKLVPTTLIPGRSDPAKAGLLPGLNLDPEEIMRLRHERFRIPPFKGSKATETTGTINNIVIFIRFSDQPEYTTDISYYNSAFNASGSVSMGQYFKEVSKTQLIINTSLYPATTSTVISYQDPHSRNYYCKYNLSTNPDGYQGDGERANREMALLKNATEAVKTQIEATGLNFDNDNDTYVDNVCFIVQGAVEGWNDLLWPHKWALYLPEYAVYISGVQVMTFNFQLSQSFNVSVLCHEMSHSIGFPDLYRYSPSDIVPVGYWDIMAYNSNPPQHQSAYSKHKYGQWFAGIPQITTGGTYSLAPLSTDAFAGYKILSPNSSQEYFMLEYRKDEGMFESGLYGSGLIISRVAPYLDGNSGGPPDEVYVYRFNGTATVNGDIFSAPFSSESGRTTFNATSNPSCFLSDGSPGGIEITNIGSAGTTISFTVNFPAAAPVLSVTPLSQAMNFAGGSTSFNVNNTGGGTMAWSAATAAGSEWVHITSGAGGSNTGTIIITAEANPANAIRTGMITVTASGAIGSPKTVTIVQSANPPVLNVLPSSRQVDFAAGSTTFSVTNTGGGTMDWSAIPAAGSSWLHITAGTSGSNAGTIHVDVDANPDNSLRTGFITVTSAGTAGSPTTVSIGQAANPPVLSVLPSSCSIEFAAGSTTFSVTNTGGGTMDWSAIPAAGSSWLHITAGTSGSNAGTIEVSADANPFDAIRTGTITVTAAGATGSPATATIVQAGSPPILSVLPSSRSIDFNSVTTSFSVSNTGAGTMNWTAVPETGLSWVHITSGTSGGNIGTIEVSADANPDNLIRTGSITVAADGAVGSPKTVTLIQDANPPVIRAWPDTHNVSFAGASATFVVENTGGGIMDWTASVQSGIPWVHITDGTSGSNSGTISASVDSNPDNAIRTATVTLTAATATNSPLTLSVVQSANEPVISVSPGNVSVPTDGFTTTIQVSNTGGGTMDWIAAVTEGSGWVQITSGTNGTDGGQLTVRVNPNSGHNPRTGIITVTSAESSNGSAIISINQEANPYKPDLLITHISTIVPSVTWPEEIGISLKIGNIGECPSAPTSIHFYLSDSPALVDVFENLGQTGCDPINQGSDYSIDLNISITESLPPGNYYLIAVVDESGPNNELDETNNTASCQVSILDAILTETGITRFSVYPVPATSRLTVHFESDGIRAERLIISNIIGQPVYSLTLEKDMSLITTIDISYWFKGCYLISLYTDHKPYFKWIVVR